MLLAEKSNRRVRIADDKKEEYIGMGYTVKNMDGSVIMTPDNPKKKVQELEAELKAAREEAAAASNARMDLMESIRTENEALKAENVDLKEKLEEAARYAENADKQIAVLESELKKIASSETPKKAAKPKQTDK